MRRVYYTKTKSPERKKLEQDAINSMRLAREHIGHSLLDRVRDSIKSHPQADILMNMMNEDRIDENGMVQINKAKTFDVVLKFAELCPDKAAMCKALAKDALS